MRTVKVTKEVDVLVPTAESLHVSLYRSDAKGEPPNHMRAKVALPGDAGECDCSIAEMGLGVEGEKFASAILDAMVKAAETKLGVASEK